MELFIPDKKLREAIEQKSSAVRQYGAEMAKKLHVRRDNLAAAESLADFWPPKSKPERCHELIGDLAGLFSIDLKHPYRLLFTPTKLHAPTDPQTSEDQLARWKSITKITILRIEDTHG